MDSSTSPPVPVLTLDQDTRDDKLVDTCHKGLFLHLVGKLHNNLGDLSVIKLHYMYFTYALLDKLHSNLGGLSVIRLHYILLTLLELS